MSHCYTFIKDRTLSIYERGRGFYKIFKKNFVAEGIIDLNI